MGSRDYGRFGAEKNLLTLLGFEHRTVQSVAQSLYRLWLPIFSHS
jgi:hypothetical protein